MAAISNIFRHSPDEQMKAKAQWVADMMKADGIKAEQVTQELTLAYLDEIGRRIERIQSAFMTRTGAKEAMRTLILSIA